MLTQQTIALMLEKGIFLQWMPRLTTDSAVVFRLSLPRGAIVVSVPSGDVDKWVRRLVEGVPSKQVV